MLRERVIQLLCRLTEKPLPVYSLRTPSVPASGDRKGKEKVGAEGEMPQRPQARHHEECVIGRLQRRTVANAIDVLDSYVAERSQEVGRAIDEEMAVQGADPQRIMRKRKVWFVESACFALYLACLVHEADPPHPSALAHMFFVPNNFAPSSLFRGPKGGSVYSREALPAIVLKGAFAMLRVLGGTIPRLRETRRDADWREWKASVLRIPEKRPLASAGEGGGGCDDNDEERLVSRKRKRPPSPGDAPVKKADQNTEAPPQKSPRLDVGVDENPIGEANEPSLAEKVC